MRQPAESFDPTGCIVDPVRWKANAVTASPSGSRTAGRPCRGTCLTPDAAAAAELEADIASSEWGQVIIEELPVVQAPELAPTENEFRARLKALADVQKAETEELEALHAELAAELAANEAKLATNEAALAANEVQGPPDDIQLFAVPGTLYRGAALVRRGSGTAQLLK